MKETFLSGDNKPKVTTRETGTEGERPQNIYTNKYTGLYKGVPQHSPSTTL